MEFPEKSTRTGQPAKESSVLITLLLFAVIVAIAFLAYLKSQDIEISNINIKEFAARIATLKNVETNGGGIIEIPYDIKERSVFSVYKDSIIKCNQDGIRGLNKKGDELWMKSYSMENPVIRTNGTDLLIADIGGSEACVINGRDVKWDLKTDGSIINADISQSGHVSIVQEAEGYKGKVRAFDPMGVEMFSRNIAEKFLVSATVSPSGKQFLINSVDAGGASATSSIEFTDMLGNPFAARIPKQNLLFPSIWYLSDDSVFAVGDSYVVYFDKSRNEKWGREFGTVYSSNVALGKYLVIAADSEKKAGAFGKGLTDIQVLNIKGQQVASYNIEDKVVNIETCNDMIAVNTGREVYFINTKGKLVRKHSSKSDVQYVRFFNKGEAAIITKGSVMIAKVD